MDYGMYVSAAGSLVEQARQDVIANNLANSETAGFKPDYAVFSQRLTEAQERGGLRFEVNSVLERMGGGIFLDEVRFRNGNSVYTQSSNPFHVALHGEGLFAVTDGESTYFTRAGNFQKGPDGSLVTADGKYRVLNERDQTIRIGEQGSGRVTVTENGTIRVGDNRIGKLKIAGELDPELFEKVGDNLYKARPGVEPAPAPGTVVRQYSVEQSGTESLNEMIRLIESYRSFEANMRMLQSQDQVLGKAVNEVAKLA